MKHIIIYIALGWTDSSFLRDEYFKNIVKSSTANGEWMRGSLEPSVVWEWSASTSQSRSKLTIYSYYSFGAEPNHFHYICLSIAKKNDLDIILKEHRLINEIHKVCFGHGPIKLDILIGTHSWWSFSFLMFDKALDPQARKQAVLIKEIVQIVHALLPHGIQLAILPHDTMFLLPIGDQYWFREAAIGSITWTLWGCGTADRAQRSEDFPKTDRWAKEDDDMSVDEQIAMSALPPEIHKESMIEKMAMAACDVMPHIIHSVDGLVVSIDDALPPTINVHDPRGIGAAGLFANLSWIEDAVDPPLIHKISRPLTSLYSPYLDGLRRVAVACAKASGEKKIKYYYGQEMQFIPGKKELIPVNQDLEKFKYYFADKIVRLFDNIYDRNIPSELSEEETDPTYALFRVTIGTLLKRFSHILTKSRTYAEFNEAVLLLPHLLFRGLESDDSRHTLLSYEGLSSHISEVEIRATSAKMETRARALRLLHKNQLSIELLRRYVCASLANFTY